MYLHGLASAFPPHRLTQEEAFQCLRESPHAEKLRPGTMELLRKVLMNPASGVDERRFATNDFSWLFAADAEALNQYFEREAPRLAGTALERALDRAGLAPDQVDALFISTCTGFLCPGVSSYVAEQTGMRSDAVLIDVTGLGCGAAIPLMRSAADFLRANPGACAVTVAVEICSAAFFLDDNAGVVISAALFGDGAAAAVWRGEPGQAPAMRAHDFRSLHRPNHRQSLRFENRSGKLRNILGRDVPEVGAEAVSELYAAAKLPDGTRVVSHGGGRNVLEAIRERLPGLPLSEAAWVLQRYGNVSSPSVLVALERALETGLTGEAWLTSFGAGFSAHACRLSPDRPVS